MATWTLRPSGLPSHLDPEEVAKRMSDECSGLNVRIPPPDYYMNEGIESDDFVLDLDLEPDEILIEREEGEDETYVVSEGDELSTRTTQTEELKETGLDPIGRNVWENAGKLVVERNIYSHLASTYSFSVRSENAYGEEHAELETLTTTPPSFLFIGKNGVGKSTQASLLAKKFNSILITPYTLYDHYKNAELPEEFELVNWDTGTLNLKTIFALLLCRIYDLDVLHRGYILDGFPLYTSEEVSVEEQLRFIYELPRRPDFIFIIQMQDVDLFNRRRKQKMDFRTNIVYTLPQYFYQEIRDPTSELNNFKLLKSDQENQNRRESEGTQSAAGLSDDLREIDGEDGVEFVTSKILDEEDFYGRANKKWRSILEKEFEALTQDVIGRLVSRHEDRPSAIKEDLDAFRAALPFLQAFIDSFDSRKILELNGYKFPSEIFSNICNFIEAHGMTPTAIPFRLITNKRKIRYSTLLMRSEDSGDVEEEEEGEMRGEESECIPLPGDDEYPSDWSVVERACVIRSRIDPRFRWKMSRWGNLCPVSLKMGRSVVGKPDLAVAYLDKVYFLSSEEAFEKFETNPRPFLLPAMPTSPAKFFVTGHPLAGKTHFCSELAKFLGASVVDMRREVRKRFRDVKHDYMFRARLKAVFETIRMVDRENFEEWKRLERARREDLMTYIKVIASMGFDEEGDKPMSPLDKAATLSHGLGDTYSGACTNTDGLLGFSWKDFTEKVRLSRLWPIQRKLELAWKLFKEKKLRYKVKKRSLLRLLRNHQKYYQKSEEGEEGGEGERGDEILGEAGSEDEGETQPFPKRKKRRRKMRQFCKPKTVEKEEETIEREVESIASSVFGDDDEPEESLSLRYPNIPATLIQQHARPSNVTESDPYVEKLLKEKMDEVEKWVDSLPPEIYQEILQRAIKEAEFNYLKGNKLGPLSGGWIVDNLSLDSAKWEVALKDTLTCPDNVIVLMDNSENKTLLIEKLRSIQWIEDDSRLQTCGLASAAPINETELSGETESCLFRDLQQDHINFYTDATTPPPDSTARILNLLPADNLKIETELQAKISESQSAQELDFKISQSENETILRDKLRLLSLRDSVSDLPQKELLKSWFKTFAHFSKPKKHEESSSNLKLDPIWGRPNARDPDIKKDEKEQLTDLDFERSGEKREERKLYYEFLSFPSKKFLEDAEKGDAEFVWEDQIKGMHAPSTTPNNEEEEFELENEEALNIESTQETEPKFKPSVPYLRQMKIIRIFDSFWANIPTLLKKYNVSTWELGLISPTDSPELTFTRINNLWNELESRFLHKATPLSEGDLRDEVEEWEEANKKWAFEPDLVDKKEDEDQGEETDEDEIEGEGGNYEAYKDELWKYVNFPEEYLKEREIKDRMRHFGDYNGHCPVTLKEMGLLQRGSPRYAAKYLGQVYFFANEFSRFKFYKNPQSYVFEKQPPEAPPPRICITGTPGCAQEEVAFKISQEHGIYLVNFRQRLHEVIKVKLGVNVGPAYLASTKNAREFLNKSEAEIELGGEGDENEIGLKDLEEELGERSREFDEISLKSLGILDRGLRPSRCPNTEESKLEKLIVKNWDSLSPVEESIRNFLEFGTQLTPLVLDEFIMPLWQDEPYRTRGFLLVGFPNTSEDVAYLFERSLIPETVLILESTKMSLRSRLLRPTVDEWFKEHPKTKELLTNRILGKKESPKIRPLTRGEKDILLQQEVPIPESDKVAEVERDGLYKSKNNSIVSEISRNLSHWHMLYAKSLKKMKMELNKYNFAWKPLHTDLSLNNAKRELTSLLTNQINNRQGLLETTLNLSPDEAELLLEKGFFRLSRFGRVCPVYAYSGRTASSYPWHHQGFPMVHRGFVYFLANRENANLFRGNPLKYIKCSLPMPVSPQYIFMIGGPKSGKSALGIRLATNLGLNFITQEGLISDTLRNSFLYNVGHDDSYKFMPYNKMALADEIMSYLRKGQTVPDYITFTALDYYLMNYQSQYYGAVFDAYPLSDVQLQRLLERGIVPSLVVNLKLKPGETYGVHPMNANEETTYFWINGRLSIEPYNVSPKFLDYIRENDEAITAHTLKWYEEEIQCMTEMDATQRAPIILQQLEKRAIEIQARVQKYIAARIKGLPTTIDSVSPLTSILPQKLSSAFGKFDPVSLNEFDELRHVAHLKDLTKIVEYRGELYVFTSQSNVELFLKNPSKYTLPNCAKTPPKHIPIPCSLNQTEMRELKQVWGFGEFDPVKYLNGNLNYKALQFGDPALSIEYKEKVYFFISKENQMEFLKKPEKYVDLMLPKKLPKRTESSKPLDVLSPAGYLIATGLTNELIRMLEEVGKLRPKYPFMSSTKSSLLYLGCHLKTLDMKSSIETRDYYRKAMSRMMNGQRDAKQLFQELNSSPGKLFTNENLKKRVDEFLSLAHKTDGERVLDPMIKDLKFTYEDA